MTVRLPESIIQRVFTRTDDLPIELAGLNPRVHEIRARVSGSGAYFVVTCDNPCPLSTDDGMLGLPMLLGDEHLARIQAMTRDQAINRLRVLIGMAARRLARDVVARKGALSDRT